MRVEVTRLTRRGAAVMRKPETVTAASIRFGRGTGNEVSLTDLRVDLSAACLSQRADGLFIEVLGDAPLRVNGQSTTAALVHSGDEILIGPYKIVLAEPPEGFDAAFSVELVQPMGDALQRLMTQSRIRLEETGLSKRRASWALFVVFALLCLATPIVAYSLGHVMSRSTEAPEVGPLGFVAMWWNPGELSNQHRYFASHCATCHQHAFTAVKDPACLTCHGAIGNHIEAASRDLGPIHQRLQRTRCAECHQEHRGLRSLVIREGALCVGCHRSLTEIMPSAGLRDVRGFPDGHPQFRVSVVADAGTQRLTRTDLDAQPKPADHPNLVFSHAAHLVPEGFPVLGYKPMVCADCHVPEPSGQGFLAITYKGQCHNCHTQKFDAALPGKEVPHGDDERVMTEVEGFYASIALREGGPSGGAPAPEIERRLPDSLSPPPSDPPGRRAWVREQTTRALGIIFDEKRGCFYCHVPDNTRGPFHVAPVMMLTRFLAPARFDHAKHAPIECDHCHDARHSQASSDVLVPGIATCVTCHGAESASFKAQSTCTSCHIFHRQELGPMRQVMAGEQ
ncbi:MAG TPA: cytochrome c3 family protein [Pseudomonadota bacterium]|nr:cytochrome c3 family protein [Stellaceae bacterium]HKN08402.1 cytochrome c3 family protein [Pseudomonadota bacterium]